MSKSDREPIPLRKINPETGRSEYAGSQSRAGKDGPSPSQLPQSNLNSILPGSPEVNNLRDEKLDEAYALLSRKIKRPGRVIDKLINDAIDSIDITVVTPNCWQCGSAGTLTVNARAYEAFQNGALVQDAFPDLAPPIREQLKTGVHPACWNSMLNPKK